MVISPNGGSITWKVVKEVTDEKIKGSTRERLILIKVKRFSYTSKYNKTRKI